VRGDGGGGFGRVLCETERWMQTAVSRSAATSTLSATVTSQQVRAASARPAVSRSSTSSHSRTYLLIVALAQRQLCNFPTRRRTCIAQNTSTSRNVGNMQTVFSDVSVSQGSVATRARYGGTFNKRFTANLLENQPVKEF